MNKRLLQFLMILLLALLYVGCDPVGMSQMNLLGDLLNSDVGPTLSAEHSISGRRVFPFISLLQTRMLPQKMVKSM